LSNKIYFIYFIYFKYQVYSQRAFDLPISVQKLKKSLVVYREPQRFFKKFYTLALFAKEIVVPRQGSSHFVE